MINEAEFTIFLQRGVGPLTFGMTREQIASFADIYGPSLTRTSGIEGNTFDETMEMLAKFMPPADLAAARSSYENANSGGLVISEFYENSGLILDYEKGRLALVQLTPKARLANIGGVFVFEETSRNVIKIFERLNRSAGKYFKSSAEFANISVYLENFTVVVGGQRVEMINSTDTQSVERVIGLRGKPFPIDGNAAWPKIKQSFLP